MPTKVHPSLLMNAEIIECKVKVDGSIELTLQLANGRLVDFYADAYQAYL